MENNDKINWENLNIKQCREIFRGVDLDISNFTIEDFHINEEKMEILCNKNRII